jgi:hypothetical protein
MQNKFKVGDVVVLTQRFKELQHLNNYYHTNRMVVKELRPNTQANGIMVCMKYLDSDEQMNVSATLLKLDAAYMRKERIRNLLPSI